MRYMAVGLASEAGPLLAKTESAAFYFFFFWSFFVGSGGGGMIARNSERTLCARARERARERECQRCAQDVIAA